MFNEMMYRLLIAFVFVLCLTNEAYSYIMDTIPNNGITCPPKAPHLKTLNGNNIVGKDVNELLNHLYQQEITQLNDYISIMSDRTKSIETRNYYRDLALKLFIANGNAYETDGILDSGVKIEVLSIHKKNPVRRLLKDYFIGLVNFRYPKVNLQPIKVNGIEVIDYKKIDENNYELSAYISQKSFVGMRDAKPMFTDGTRKKCKIHIHTENTGKDQEVIVLLGDVIALEIHND